MIPQFLIPGLWFYVENNDKPFYIGNVNNQTAQLLRKTELNGVPMTDSCHCLFNQLLGITLTPLILGDQFGFVVRNDHEDDFYMYKELYPELRIKNPETGFLDLVKPATYLLIDMDGSKRFTNYLKCGDNKIYLGEISYVHELQLLLFTHTQKFPVVTITKNKI